LLADGELQNISMYVGACEQGGIEPLFSAEDFGDKGDVRKVLDNLLAFIEVAVDSGFPAFQLLPENDGESKDAAPVTEKTVTAKPATSTPPPPVVAQPAVAVVSPPAAVSPPVKTAAVVPTNPPSRALPPKAAASPGRAAAPPPAAVSRPKIAAPSVVAPVTRPATLAPPSQAPGAPTSAGQVSPRAGTAPLSPRPASPRRPVQLEPEPVEESVTRSRGETANLLNWQPPTSSVDEAVKLENTRLKATAERATLTATTQTKLKDDALAKLAKEKEKVRELEEELEAERKKKSEPSGAAGSGVSAAAAERDALKLTVEELKKSAASAEAKAEEGDTGKIELEMRLQQSEEKCAELEQKVSELEGVVASVQKEAEAREAASRREARQLEDDALYLTSELNRAKEAQAKSEEASANTIAALKEEVAKARQEAENDRQSAEEEVSALKALQKLQKVDTSAIENTEITLLKSKVTKLEADKKAAEFEIVSLNNKVEELRKTVAEKKVEPVKIEPVKIEPVPLVAPRAVENKPVNLSPRGAFKSSVRDIKEDRLLQSSSMDMEMPELGDAGMNLSESTNGLASESELMALLEGKSTKLNPGLFEDNQDNRDALAAAMKKFCKGRAGKMVDVLIEKNFQNLIEIVGVLLQKLDPESPEDFKVAKKVLKLGSIVRKGKAGKLLRESLSNLRVFKEPIFWDDLFAAKLTKVLERDPDLDPNDAVRAVLEELGAVMVSWGVGDAVVLEVIAHGAECEGLSAEEADEIVTSVLGEGAGNSNRAVEDEDGADNSPAVEVVAAPTETKAGPLKFKKGPKWIKANFALRGNKLCYEYVDEGIGDFSEELLLTAAHEASASSDQAPGALRNYSLKIINSADKSVMHLLATKQPEINEWINAINDVPARKGVAPSAAKTSLSPRGKAGSDAAVSPAVKKTVIAPSGPDRAQSAKVGSTRPAPGPSKGTTKNGATAGTAPKPTSLASQNSDLRKGSQPPVRVTRSETQSERLAKEGDVKMLVAKRWLRTHVELFDTSLVLTYVDPVTNTDQVREEIPIAHVLIAPNSPLAPAALKDSSWRIKDGDTELHLMSSSKSDATGWLNTIKATRDSLKK
jgi:hypothetical protein